MIIPHRVTHPNWANVQALDRLPMPTIEDMMSLGVAIDVEYFKSLEEEMRDTRATLEDKIRRRIPRDKLIEFLGLSEDGEDDDDLDAPIDFSKQFKVSSPEQIAWLLFDLLELGKGKSLVMTADGKRVSTGKKQLEQLKSEHEIVQDILNYREVHKLETTYVRKLPRIAKFHPRGRLCPVCGRRHRRSSNRIHSTIVTTRTETGRLALRRPNNSQIPSRTPLGRKVRRGFIPSYGKKLVACDESQIELRVLASESRDPFMISCFKDKRDLHAELALKVMRIDGTTGFDPVSKSLFARKPGIQLVSKEEFDTMRSGSKTANFGIVYGMTDIGLQAALALLGIYWTRKECFDFIEITWHKVFDHVRPFMNEQHYRAKMYKFVWDIWGAVRYIWGVNSASRKTYSEALRQAGNMPIQSSASAFLKIIMWLVRAMYDEFRREGYEVDPLIPIHDELVSEADEEIAEEVKVRTVKIMESVNEYAQLLVDIKAEGKVMDRWEK